MNKKIILAVGAFILAAIGLIIVSSPVQQTEYPIQVGWQPPWINQGQIAVILQRTNILEKHGLKAEFTGFSFGPPMTEAALSGRLDVIFLGDQPAFNLNSKDPSWKIVAPLIRYKSTVLVPPNSPIQSLSDLKEKTIATGIGSTTYRDVLQALSQAGIQAEEVTIKNLNIDEHLAFLKAANGKDWGDIDAIATYDPTTTIAISQGFAKKIAEFQSLGVIAMNEKLAQQNPKKAKQFIEAVEEAFAYYATHQIEVNKWYAEVSRYETSQQLFNEMAKQEPKLNEKNPTLNLDSETLSILQQHYQIATSLKLFNNPRKFDEIILDLNKT